MKRARLRRRDADRGIVLLIVISLLVLFMLIAVTYAVVAGQYKQAAAAQSTFQATGDHPHKDLDLVAYMILRDAPQGSVLGEHSLLNDLYGSDVAGGNVVDALPANPNLDVIPEAGGQFVHLQFNPLGTVSQLAGYYNGCVLTFVTGPARGYSTRIVGYSPPVYNNMGTLIQAGEIRYESQDSDGTSVPLPRATDTFGINGRPFNGVGPGLDLSTGNIDARVAINGVTNIGGVPLIAALLPNYAAYQGDPYTTTGMTALQFPVNVGGPDESFDAPTFHDMWLAYLPSSAEASPQDLILPSYHRPDLVAFWINILANSLLSGISPAQQVQVFNFPYGPDGIPNNADDSGAPWTTVNTNGAGLTPAIPNACDFIAKLKRHFVLRPLQQDHPNFTGSNSNFTLTGTLSGAFKIWDVDNDGDGVADSIWIDPGLPVATSPEGRRYKRLFAIMIRDLDGRVNLNAHDALAHLANTYTQQFSSGSNPAVVGLPGGGTTLSRGLGVGPADIYLGNIFTTNHLGIVTGRYGADGFPGINGVDSLGWLKTLGIPGNYNVAGLSYGSPPDLSGQGAVAVDHFGQPVTGFMGMATELTNHPYEFDPIRGSAADSRYTLGELERVLRFYDVDANTLPQRLLYTAPAEFNDPRARRLVTTHSVHIPAPNVQFYPEVRSGTATWAQYLPMASTTPAQLGINATPPTILDIFRARLREGLGAISTPAQLNNFNQQLTLIVPFEILHGQPFDLNRWIGNGLDDNGNFAVDDLAEENTGETVWSGGSTPAGFNGVTFNYVNDAPAVIEPRQMYARQLYCLMRAVMDDQYNWEVQPGTSEAGFNVQQRQEILYRRVAQWAINTIDFRDRDAIMTGFEYDVNPFNGWICDGNPNTNEGNDGVDNDGDGMTDEADEQERRLIYGAEYPDLIVSETFAMHDRRVKDTAHDQTGQYRWDSTAMRFRDNDVDQYRKPEGTTMVELYSTRNFSSNNAAFPAELYDAAGNLDLGRMAPARTFGGAGQPARHPVWRAVVCAPPPAGGPQGIEGYATQFPDSAIFEPATFGQPVERIVWFAPQDPTNMGSSDVNRVFWGRTGGLNAQGNQNLPQTSNVLLPPNRHVVVGPRPDTRIGSLRNGPDGDPNTLDVSPHSLQLAGGLFSITGGFYATPAFGYPIATPNMGAVIPQPLGIVCAAKPPVGWTNQNYLVGFNVSEPMPQGGSYYAEPTYPNDQYCDLTVPMNVANNVCPDPPFDGGVGTALENKIRTGTYTNHRTVYLQRLANPTLAWNPDPNDPDFGSDFNPMLAINPYITIDWSTIDLTVFSGNQDNREETDTVTMSTEWIDPSDPNPFGSAPGERFGGRERGVAVTNNLWSPTTTQPPVTNSDTGDGDHYFDRMLRSTLGYLNSTYGTPAVPASGYEGAPYQGGNPNPFALLTWNNRPFANPLELMLVPASAPSRLGYEFDRWLNGGAFNPYANERDATLNYRGSFNHLLNFFHTAPPGAAPGTAAHYYRIFDFLETPSQFTGTEKWYYPSTFATDPNAISFRPPYNRLSRFREPGRMNANTAADEYEWNAFTNTYNYPTNTTSSWEQFKRSRRGYDLGSSANFPTLFSNPIRSAAAADLMPPVNGMRRSGVDATLLRSLPQMNNDPPINATTPTASNVAEFALQSGNAYQHTDRNAYFRYRGINRLSNLVSSHSNVFAVWITVGQFEVEDNPSGADEAHPDGLRLGQEIGADNGSIVRHRAFYIMDRSVPVGYERGQNHNVDRAILLRRFIE